MEKYFYSPSDTYILANYNRCTLLVWCANKLNHINCTDTRLAPLQCPVGGCTSTVSQYIICERTVYAGYFFFFKIVSTNIHRNTSAVCDDGMDIQCVTPTLGCHIHKHQLCDNIKDCESDSDEKSALCNRLTKQDCKRKYHFSTSLMIPGGWIMNGIVDCVNGIDEDITKWKRCQYPKCATYGAEHCEDVYICPSGFPLYVEIKSICDVLLSCEGGIEICFPVTLASSQQRYTPAKVENVNYLHYCLLGLEDLYEHIASCEHVTYPTVEILGAHLNYLYLPIKQVSCKYVYGEQYVYLSCSGKCYEARCPLKTTPVSSTTCYNIFKRKTYSISST